MLIIRVYSKWSFASGLIRNFESNTSNCLCEIISFFITKKNKNKFAMPAKIGKEVRQRIYDLKDKESKSVKEILGTLKSEGIKISDKSIYKQHPKGEYK